MSSIRNKLIKFLVGLGTEKVKKMAPAQLRKSFETESTRFSKLPKGTIIEPVTIGKCPAEWLTVDPENKSIILYLHGGGYVFGSMKTHRNSICQFAKAAKAKVLNLDYRLAPEHPYPAALEDAVCAYEWLLQNGHSSNEIVIAGDSAGGGLALATMMQIRDRKMPQPAAAVLISPWTDLTVSGESMETNKKNDPMCVKEKLSEWAHMYAGKTEINHPLVSPLFGSFAGLPPMLICVSADELLFSDAVGVTKKARDEGIQVQLMVENDMLHVWPLFSGMIPEAKKSAEDIGKYIFQNTLQKVS